MSKRNPRLKSRVLPSSSLARQCRRPSVLRFFLRPYSNRADRPTRHTNQLRSTSRSTANSSATQEPPSSGGRYQQAFSSYSVINSNTLTLMTRRLEQLLTEEMAAFTTTGQGRPGSRSTATIDLGEHILSLRLHGCVLRMNRVLGKYF